MTLNVTLVSKRACEQGLLTTFANGFVFLPDSTSLVGPVGVGGAFEKLGIYMKVIPRNISNIVRKSFEHVPNGSGSVNDALGYEFLDDAIFNAERVGSRVLCDVESQNLLLVFIESVESVRDALKLLPPLPPSLYPVKNVYGDTDSKECDRCDERDSKPRTIILCEVENPEALEKALGTEKKKGREDAKCYQIARREFEELKNSAPALNQMGKT